MKNEHKLDPKKTWQGGGQEGHFFVSSVAEWRTGRDIEYLIKQMRKDPYPFTVWFVPLDEDASYKIVNYGPDVEEAVFVASYGWFLY